MPEKPGLKTLALDTSSPSGSVALLEGREIVAELRLNSFATHSARLLRSIDFLLDSSGLALRDMNLMAAGIGPGSFTGIRIGVATALGLAQSLSVPFAGISGMDALAHQYSFLEGTLGVLMDAQRSQVYYSEYQVRRGRIRRVGKPRLLNPRELVPGLRKRHMYIVGAKNLACMENVCSPASTWPRAIRAEMFLASAIGKLASSNGRYWRAGDYLSAEPLYIRPPDALRPTGRR